MPEFLLKGLLIGFAIAAPVGPIGVLCIRRTLTEGRAFGLAAGLGAATADALYGAIAGFGLAAVSTFLPEHRAALQLLGGGFLLGLGLRTFLGKPLLEAERTSNGGLAGSYLAAAALTLANPAALLSFAAVFAGAGLAQAPSGAWAATLLVAGVFLGSTAWWLILSGVVDTWRRRAAVQLLGSGAISGAVLTGVALGYSARYLRGINRGSGIVLAGFGAWALAEALGT